MQFVDEITFHAAAGKGGDGSVHFARRKYQPFAGPDGGPGGDGGHVHIVSSRSVDSLDHFYNMKTKAESGAAGTGNLMIGARGNDLDIKVPPGTMAFGARTNQYIGSVKGSSEKLMLAHGGRGGKGNTSYASGRRRSPDFAQDGAEGQKLDVRLLYRIFAETTLIEPLDYHECCLLPVILGIDPTDTDFDLYRRRPRWLRVEHDFKRFDASFLPFEYFEGVLEEHHFAHLYWTKHCVVNLVALQDDAGDAASQIEAEISGQDLPNLTRLTFIWPDGNAGEIKELEGHIDVTVLNVAAGNPDETMAEFCSELTGGIVE